MHGADAGSQVPHAARRTRLRHLSFVALRRRRRRSGSGTGRDGGEWPLNFPSRFLKVIVVVVKGGQKRKEKKRTVLRREAEAPQSTAHSPQRVPVVPLRRARWYEVGMTFGRCPASRCSENLPRVSSPDCRNLPSSPHARRVTRHRARNQHNAIHLARAR